MNNIYSNTDIESKLVYGTPARDNDLCIMVPTYKRTDLLKKAINSLLSQTEPKQLKYQIYIVSNDPLFKLEDLADVHLKEEKFCIFVNEENLGMVGNINRCIFLSKGRYVAYLHDDDLLLDNYLIEIEKLYLDGSLENIDCLLPNSYYFYDPNNDGIFGKRAIIKARLKEAMCAIIRIGKKRELFERIHIDDCIKAWYTAGSGGPTCGVIYKRETLLRTNGFDSAYPYAFDFLYMFDFMSKYNVVFLNKDLAVYRMSDSASNTAKVQDDWIRGCKYLLDCFRHMPYIAKNENEILRYCIESMCKEEQNAYKGEYEINNLKYFSYRIHRLLFEMRSGLYREKVMPGQYQRLL